MKKESIYLIFVIVIIVFIILNFVYVSLKAPSFGEDEGVLYSLFKSLGNNGLSKFMKKDLIIFGNSVYFPDYTLDVNSTLDFVEAYDGNSYAYFLVDEKRTFLDEYNPVEDKWPFLEELLKEAQKRDIDIWVYFKSPSSINDEGDREYKKLLYKDWFNSLAKLSKNYSNLKGGIIDDFINENYWSGSEWKDINGEQLFTPEYLGEMRDLIASENPEFKFYPVLYWDGIFNEGWSTDPNQELTLNEGFKARRDYFDGVIYFYRDQSRNRGLCDPVLEGLDYYTDDGCDDFLNMNLRYWDTLDYEISKVSEVLNNEQRLIIGSYTVSHSKLVPPNDIYTGNVLNISLEQTNGVLSYYLIRISKILDSNFCDEFADDSELIEKKACVLKKIFQQYNNFIPNLISKSELIFTFYPVPLEEESSLEIIQEVMQTGMTHAGIAVDTFNKDIEQKIKTLQDSDYKFVLIKGPEDDFLIKEDSIEQFFNASCLDKLLCENWNTTRGINPLYNGTYWKKILESLQNYTKKLNPELVFYDIEYWSKADEIEYYFNSKGDPGNDCNCNIIEKGIGYDDYYKAWKRRGLDLKEAVKSVNSESGVYFYNEIPSNGKKILPDYKGKLISYDYGYMRPGVGDAPSPSLYVLPNLEVLEENIKSMDLFGAIPWISFNYMEGYSNYNGRNIYFDFKVSEKAGRMLRMAGAKGFVIYPGPFDLKNQLGEAGYEYWLGHARAIIKGFEEAEDYTELNKIKNPNFEAFRTKTSDYDYDFYGKIYLTGGTQFAPIFWSWIDSNISYEDNEDYSNLSRDSVSGMYSWEHKRKEDVGFREIYSKDFFVDKEDNYFFSIDIKSNINSDLGRINISLINKESLNEEIISEVNFSSLWQNILKEIIISPGAYKIKIYIEDKTKQNVSIFLDNIKLINKDFWEEENPPEVSDSRRISRSSDNRKVFNNAKSYPVGDIKDLENFLDREIPFIPPTPISEKKPSENYFLKRNISFFVFGNLFLITGLFIIFFMKFLREIDY